MKTMMTILISYILLGFMLATFSLPVLIEEFSGDKRKVTDGFIFIVMLWPVHIIIQIFKAFMGK